MLGGRVAQDVLFQGFRLATHVPAERLPRSTGRFVVLRELRELLRPHYGDSGRPLIDPELMLLVLTTGYSTGARSAQATSCGSMRRTGFSKAFYSTDITGFKA